MRITLEVASGPDVGRKLWLGPQQSIVVGRTQLAEFSIPSDVQLSSIHFQVAWKDGGFQIRDLKSTNGTRLNGQAIHEAMLNAGDVIQAGKTKFAVLVEIEVSSPPTEVMHRPPKEDKATRPPEIPIGPPTEAIPREFLVLPVPSDTSGTLIFNAPIPALAEVEVGAADEVDEPAELLEIDNRTPFSVACLPWQNAEGLGRLTVIVKATFCFAEGEATAAEAQLPISFADQHEDDDPLKPVKFEADTAPFKPRTDVVVVGQAYAPGGRPRTSVDVRLRVGSLNKRLRVFGDRKWIFPTRLAVVPQVSDTAPFTQMPLSYTRAFGGIDGPAARYCAENLTGIGFIGEPTPASIHNKPLPNIEDPDHLVESWNSRPRPVGLGYYGRGWLPRLQFAGTYDDAHRRSRAPLPPKDFSYEVHNGAHPDLQVAGYLDGDELVELENLTRDGYAKFSLPGVRPRITLTRYVESAAARAGTFRGNGDLQTKTERPVQPFLDAVVFIPDERIFYEVFRAVFAVRDIDALDIARIKIE